MSNSFVHHVLVRGHLHIHPVCGGLLLLPGHVSDPLDFDHWPAYLNAKMFVCVSGARAAPEIRKEP